VPDQADPFTLQLIPEADLHVLAASQLPPSVASRVAEGALMPSFAAVRALNFLAQGHAPFWANTFYIVRNADQQVVGGCGFKGAPADGCAELGYGVSPTCRNQGVATAGVGELLRLAFANGELGEVLAQVSPDNVSSTRVVQKLGFVETGIEPDPDDVLYVQWRLRRLLPPASG
jgi:ribosomal-protein-alanine N-acetyltransferase